MQSMGNSQDVEYLKNGWSQSETDEIQILYEVS